MLFALFVLMLHLILSYIHSSSSSSSSLYMYMYICIVYARGIPRLYVHGIFTWSGRQRNARPWNGIALNAICPIFQHMYLLGPRHCILNPLGCVMVPLRLFQYPDDAYCCDVWHLKPAKVRFALLEDTIDRLKVFLYIAIWVHIVSFVSFLV